MTAVLDDEFADLTTDSVEARSGPLSGSRGTNRTAGTTRRKPGVRLQKKLDELQKKLSGEMFQAGAIMGMGLPVTGYYVCQESDQFTRAVIDLASSRPEWIEALEHIAAIGPGLTIGRTILGIGGALSIDRKRNDAEKQAAAANSRMMRFLGVWSAYQAVMEEKPVEEAGVYATTYSPPPAPSFQPIA